MRRSGRVRRFGLIGVATALVITLAGCSADSRVPVVEQEIADTATRATPLMIGVLTPDVAKVLEKAGDQTSVLMPVLAPDLTTATAEVNAQPATTEPLRTVDEAAAALADSGLAAWLAWLEGNRDAVGYVETSIPVTVSGKDGGPASVRVDEAALRLFAEPIEQANLELFVSAAERTPQWQRAMVEVHALDFLSPVTGLTGTFLGLATLESVEPAGDGRFTVAVSHPDPRDAILYQVQKALESYGTGKIWGEVTRADFESRMDSITDLPADQPRSTTQATVKVTTTAEGQYQLTASLRDNLAAQAVRYRAEAEPGSFTAPADLDRVREDAIAGALEELAKRVVKEQKRPGTKLLVGGKSGQRVTIRTGRSGDKHVTFFKWDSKKQVASAFIRSGKTLSLRLPRGNYRLVYSSGDTWYGKKYSFGPTGRYTEFKASSSVSGPMKIVIKANYTYTVSIETGSGGDSGSVPSGSTDNPYEE